MQEFSRRRAAGMSASLEEGMKKFFAMTAAAVLPFVGGCQSTMDHTIADRDQRLNTFIKEELEKGEFPGIQYLVVSRDSILFNCAGGLADIAAARPMESGMTMMIYSMTKTITAAAVLQLVEQGLVSLDDPVTKFLPGIPYGTGVKIRHLLAQTSGIPNPIPLKWVHLAPEHSEFNQQSALRQVMEENSALRFEPGEKYGYSNISYWLLGAVVEKVTGSSFEEYVRHHLFRKLGIPPTEADFIIPVPEHHARGYLPKWSYMNLLKSFVIESKFIGEYEGDWLHINDHYLNGPAFGGIVASARAIGLFLQDQLRDSSVLLSKETKAAFFQQQRNNGGELVDMTLGWHIGALDGVRYFFKEGGGGGFHSEMRLYPAAGVATVAIANNTSFDATGFLSTADREFFGK
jgi:D-alanyl-D-alanine carboxypeptidase